MNKKIYIIAGLGLAAYFLATRKTAAQPARGLPIVNGSIANTTSAAQDPFTALGANIGKLWNTFTSPEIVRPIGYVPTYTPDTTGEAAALRYYVDNRDSFAVNPPTITPEMQLAAQREGMSEY